MASRHVMERTGGRITHMPRGPNEGPTQRVTVMLLCFSAMLHPRERSGCQRRVLLHAPRVVRAVNPTQTNGTGWACYRRPAERESRNGVIPRCGAVKRTARGGDNSLPTCLRVQCQPSIAKSAPHGFREPAFFAYGIYPTFRGEIRFGGMARRGRACEPFQQTAKSFDLFWFPPRADLFQRWHPEEALPHLVGFASRTCRSSGHRVGISGRQLARRLPLGRG